MPNATLSSANLMPSSDESIETLGLSGTTLMQLWSIGVARTSELTAYNTEGLRDKLIESLDGTINARKLTDKAIADIHAAMRSRNKTLKDDGKTGEVIVLKPEAREKIRILPPRETKVSEPDHQFLDQSNVGVSLISKDPLEIYYQDLRRFKKFLSADQEVELGRRVREENDMAARDILVRHNLRLVLWIARKHLFKINARRNEWSGLDYSDLVQEGNIGLITAASQYDYRKGFRFTTYAQWWIRAAIGRVITNSGFIRIPAHLDESVSKVTRIMEDIALREGRPPSIEEIAIVAEMDASKVRQVLKAAQTSVSMAALNEVIADSRDGSPSGENELGDFIVDERFLRPDRALEAQQELDAACKRLNHLTEMLYADESISERNRVIFVSLYGLGGSLRMRTLEHVGENYDITRERIRQIILICWEKLQKSGLDMDHDSVVEELERIGELENLTHKRVSVT